MYNFEKYKDKREKVLGIKSRGMGFYTIVLITCLVIISGLSLATVPQVFSYITTRNLEDAIFKMDKGSTWSDEVIRQTLAIEGVKNALRDRHRTRLVVTYDRQKIQLSTINSVFARQNLNATLLNQMNHRQRKKLLKKEEEKR
jgi:hypothetical protein